MVSGIEYIVQDKIWIEDLGKNSEIGVSPAYLIVGARFIEPVFSGRMNPPPTKNKLIAKKEEINGKRETK